MGHSSQGEKDKREILTHQVNWDNSIQISVEPIDCQGCWEKKNSLLQVGYK